MRILYHFSTTHRRPRHPRLCALFKISGSMQLVAPASGGENGIRLPRPAAGDDPEALVDPGGVRTPICAVTLCDVWSRRGQHLEPTRTADGRGRRSAVIADRSRRGCNWAESGRSLVALVGPESAHCEHSSLARDVADRREQNTRAGLRFLAATGAGGALGEIDSSAARSSRRADGRRRMVRMRMACSAPPVRQAHERRRAKGNARRLRQRLCAVCGLTFLSRRYSVHSQRNLRKTDGFLQKRHSRLF